MNRERFIRHLTLGAIVLALWPSRALTALPRAVVAKPFPHPEPRAGITAERVLPDDQLPDEREVREAYAAARAYPAIFDGLYCACRCQRSHGHRSLLSCFESDQPTGCMGCREEAELAARLASAGRSLAAVRAAVDAEWG